MIKRICIFGDSIAYGSGDFEFGGWQNHLKVYFSKTGKFQSTYNLAVGGRNSDDIIGRFKNELVSRNQSAPGKDMLAIISIPINDSRFTHVNGQREFKIDIRKFKSNLQRLKKLADNYADKTIFLGMTSVVDEKTNPWYMVDNGHCWENAIIKKYNSVLEKFCLKEEILFLNMFNSLNDEDLPDGLHPNTEGHKKMFEQIKNFLVANSLIE